MTVLIDWRLKKFLEGFLYGENEEVISIHLKDIDETFIFDNEVILQNFLNKQAIERFGHKELRTGSFDYEDEYGTIHRYFIEELSRSGEIISYNEEVIISDEVIEVALWEGDQRKQKKKSGQILSMSVWIIPKRESCNSCLISKEFQNIKSLGMGLNCSIRSLKINVEINFITNKA